ncbi:hypothetical protein MKW92_044382 [Papaver armeniacum]|nr:hypothetical protein MKW92_044382 [Papaver armeniacum]
MLFREIATIVKNKAILPLFFFVVVCFLIFDSHECQDEESITVVILITLIKQFQQQHHPSVEATACSYTLAIKISCSSKSFTRDQISLAFGDAYGNQVLAPRLHDPSSMSFKRCSTDTYYFSGLCTYRICHLYLYR